MAAIANHESVATMPQTEHYQERSLLRRMFSFAPWVATTFMIMRFFLGGF
jgi:hypothetical protein